MTDYLCDPEGTYEKIPVTHKTPKLNKDKPKYVMPVHEIDFKDPYLDEDDIYHD